MNFTNYTNSHRLGERKRKRSRNNTNRTNYTNSHRLGVINESYRNDTNYTNYTSSYRLRVRKKSNRNYTNYTSFLSHVTNGSLLQRSGSCKRKTMKWRTQEDKWKRHAINCVQTFRPVSFLHSRIVRVSRTMPPFQVFSGDGRKERVGISTANTMLP